MKPLKLEPEKALLAIAEAEETLGLTLMPIHYEILYRTLIGEEVQWYGSRKGGKDSVSRILMHVTTHHG